MTHNVPTFEDPEAEINELRAENERLQRDLEGMYEHDREQSGEVSQVHRELDAETNRAVAAEDEVERLRAALEQIASAVFYAKQTPVEAKNLQDMAREALGSADQQRRENERLRQEKKA